MSLPAEYDVRGERAGLPGYYHGLRALLSLRFAMTRGCDIGNRIRDRDRDADSDSDTDKKMLGAVRSNAKRNCAICKRMTKVRQGRSAVVVVLI